MDFKTQEHLVDKMSRIPWRKLSLLTVCLGVPLAGLVSLIVAFCVVCTEVQTSVEYSGVQFEGIEGKFTFASAPSTRSSKPISSCELFLKFPGHDAVSIHDITEEYLQKNFRVDQIASPTGYNGSDFFSQFRTEHTIYYAGFGADLKFERGRLESVTISSKSDSGVMCSNRRDGEYINFPIRTKDLIQAWGKPTHFEEVRQVERPNFGH